MTATVTCRAARRVARDHFLQREIDQRVAVDDEKRVVEKRQRVTRSAGRSENLALPRVLHADTKRRAVTDDRRDRLRTMVQVDHDV